MPCLRDLKYGLKATSNQKNNIVRSLSRLRIISERIDRNIPRRFSNTIFLSKAAMFILLIACEQALLFGRASGEAPNGELARRLFY